MKTLNQFKKNRDKLKIINELLVRCYPNNSCQIVVSFPFLVEIVDKVHRKSGHMGRHKIYEMIKDNFYHPALESVLREYVVSCEYCQCYKLNRQNIKPPTLKIDAKIPFNLLAIDLMKLDESKSKNVCVLAAMDHKSKWLSVVSLKLL